MNSRIIEILEEARNVCANIRSFTYFTDDIYAKSKDDRLNTIVMLLNLELKKLNYGDYSQIVEANYIPIDGKAISFREFVELICGDIKDYVEWSSPSKRLDLISEIAAYMQENYTIHEINPIFKIIGVKNIDNSVPASKRIYVQEKLSDIPVADLINLAKDLGIINPIPIEIAEAQEILDSKYLNEQVAKCYEKLASKDYGGAITNARTFLEEVLLRIEEKIDGKRNKNSGDISALYKRVAGKLNMENSKYEGPVKKLLDGMKDSVGALGGISDNAGDRHAGEMRNPSERHARLVINSCFTIGDFLIRSYKHQYE